MSKINILFITPSFSKGGAEKNMLNVINSLDNNKFKIDLIICTNETKYLSQVNKSINLTALNKKDIKHSIPTIIKGINQRKPDLVYMSSLSLSVFILSIKSYMKHKYKVITRIPSLPSNNFGKQTLKGRVIGFFRNNALKKATAIIAQTPEMKEEIINHYSVDPTKVHMIRNLVDIATIKRLAKEPVKLANDTFYFIAAGTLYPIKGFDYLIKAFAEHFKTNKNSELLILGGESSNHKKYKQILEQLIKDNNLKNKVHLMGHQVNPYKYYQAADAFVLSSIKEGFPNVVLENMVLNKPILATNCVSFEGIINETNGIVIERESTEALKNGLGQIKKESLNPHNTLLNFDFNKWFKSLT